MPAPTKLFDVGNGNGAVLSGETVDRGTLSKWQKIPPAQRRREQSTPTCRMVGKERAT